MFKIGSSDNELDDVLNNVKSEKQRLKMLLVLIQNKIEKIENDNMNKIKLKRLIEPTVQKYQILKICYSIR